MATLTEAQVLALTDPELEELFPMVQAEWTRRREAALSEQRIDEASTAVHATEADGIPWVQPESPAVGYPKRAIRTHISKSWMSTMPANVSVPGAAGAFWTDLTATYPAWEPKEYTLGARVSYEGVNYVSMKFKNWAIPGSTPSEWEVIA